MNKITISVCIVILLVFTPGCSNNSLVETTRTVIEKVQENNEFYLVLTDKDRGSVRVKATKELWNKIEKNASVTLKVENGELREVTKINGQGIKGNNKQP